MRIRFGWFLLFVALIFLAALKVSAQDAPRNARAAIRLPRVDHASHLEDFMSSNPPGAGLRIGDLLCVRI